MALLEILPDSDPFLRKTSRRVRHVDDKLRKLAVDMFEVMIDRYGIGLAAVQVGVPKRMFIYQVTRRKTGGYEACDKKDSEADSEKTGNPDESANPDESVEETRIIETKPSDDGELRGIESNESKESGGVGELGGAEESEELDGAGGASEKFVCINPRITYREGAFIDEEGCLSKEGWLAKVERAIKITFEAYDLNMEKFERTVTGLEARCVQHEIDHLDGILFTDRALPGTLRYAVEEEEEEGESVEGVEKSDSTEGAGENDDSVSRKEKTVGVGDN